MRLTAFVTPGALPESMQGVEGRITTVGRELQESARGKVLFELVDPDSPDSPVTRQVLQESYGIAAYPVSFFSPDSYYLHMALEAEGETTIIYPEGEMREDQIRASVEASIRRAVPGFLKTVGIWAPPQEQPPAQGGIPTTISSWNIAADQISQDYTLSPVDLTDGRVPTEIDVLAVIAPRE